MESRWDSQNGPLARTLLDEFVSEILEMILRLRWLACGGLHQVLRLAALAVLVNLLAQPAQQTCVLALLEVSGKPGKVMDGPAHELGGIQVAQGVGWKITQAAEAPVDVMQAAVGIVRHLQADRSEEHTS